MPPLSPGPRIALATLLVLGVLAGFLGNSLPRIRPATAPDSTVSAARAVHDLQVISATPHPTGTPAHDRLRDHLVDRLRQLDCENVHIQSATGFNTLDGPIAATVANVVCRKPGLRGGPAVMLTAHYDAVPRSYGAADDGAGVAAILETLRALDASAPLDRDVIVLFSDAEEDGLQGAEAFVDLHPWAKDVGVVLNVDARGDQGPVFMFQTSTGNAPLIAALAHSVPDARANSLTGDVYRYLPSDTDLSIWLHSTFGVAAMNFANIDGYTHYHTPMDNLASLDLRGVQQMGDYALGLTRQLGHAQRAHLRTHDAVYANLPLIGVVHYPVALALPLSVLAALLLAWLVLRRCRTRSVPPPAWRQGIGLVVAGVIAIPALVWFLWLMVSRLHPAFADILQHEPYDARDWLAAALALTTALFLWLVPRRDERQSLDAVAISALLLWALLGVIAAVKVPGASYLFCWPLLAMTVALLLIETNGNITTAGGIVLGVAAAIPLVLWCALIVSLETGLTVSALPICALLLTLVLLLLLPVWQAARELTRAVVIVASLGVVAMSVVAHLRGTFNAQRKDPDSLNYVIDAAHATARWMSADRKPDAWTSVMLGAITPHQVFPAFAFTHGQPMLASEPKPVDVDAIGAPAVTVSDLADGRDVHVEIPRTGSGEILHLTGLTGMPIANVSINGRALPVSDGDRYHAGYPPPANGNLLTYYGVPPEGVDFRFTVSGHAPVTLRIETAVEGLPGPLRPRPDFLMSKPFIATDMTIVERVITR